MNLSIYLSLSLSLSLCHMGVLFGESRVFHHARSFVGVYGVLLLRLWLFKTKQKNTTRAASFGGMKEPLCYAIF